MKFDRTIYFQLVNSSLFTRPTLKKREEEGQDAILSQWESEHDNGDLRHLAYPLATAYHETAREMIPIEEYGKGSGRDYGKPDPQTKQIYYGRGYVQLTWRDNYRRAARELDLKGPNDLELFPARALDPNIAADVMFFGMREGWFRKGPDGKPNTLARFFNDTVDDPYGAREIINGDKKIIPKWSNGVSIGNLIKDYHKKFLGALSAAAILEGGEYQV